MISWPSTRGPKQFLKKIPKMNIPTDFNLTIPPDEQEIVDTIYFLNDIVYKNHLSGVVRKLAFERDKYKAALKEIANHSPCCDARHTTDGVLE